MGWRSHPRSGDELGTDPIGTLSTDWALPELICTSCSEVDFLSHGEVVAYTDIRASQDFICYEREFLQTSTAT